MKTEKEVKKSLEWIRETMNEEIHQHGKTDAWSRGFETALEIVLGEERRTKNGKV